MHQFFFEAMKHRAPQVAWFISKNAARAISKTHEVEAGVVQKLSLVSLIPLMILQMMLLLMFQFLSHCVMLPWRT